MKLAPLFGCVIMLTLLSRTEAYVGVQNSDFELGTVNWKLFVSPESAGAGCQFVVENTSAHSGSKAARLTATQMARFGIRFDQATPIQVIAGHRYRLSAWVKAGANFAVDPNTPGPVLRATLFDQQMQDVAGGHIFVGLQGVQRGDPTKLNSSPVPSEWTKIEGVIEIPPGASQMVLFFFCWKSSGTLWVDDVSAVEVSASGSTAP